VCIPLDLYMRFGRDHGGASTSSGRLRRLSSDGQLRTLAGDDVRYGGLTEVVSIGFADERDGVVARLAVIRCAQVARWR
jgi:hypothetical protein